MIRVKIILVVIIFAITFSGINFVNAQAFPTGQSAIPSVPVNDGVGNFQLGQINSGIGGGLGFQSIQNILDTARRKLTSCVDVLNNLNSANAVLTYIDQLSQQGTSIVGGSFFESKALTKQLAQASIAQGCVNAYLTELKNTPTQNLIMGNSIQREQDTYTAVSVALNEYIDKVNARLNASVKDVVRAFLVKSILTLNQNLTTSLVNKLVQKYKIDDYLAYSDALATQIYSMKFINENHKGDARTQMMVRSLVMSEKFPAQAKIATAFANDKAREYVASQCQTTKIVSSGDSEGFLKCLASYGSEQSSPLFQYLNATDMAGKAKAAGVKSAQEEVSQSNGFAPPRNCSGSIQLQNQMDAHIIQVGQELEVAASVHNKLEEALDKGQTTKAEVDKALVVLNAAADKHRELPKLISSPVVDVCEAISSPSKFIATSIDNYLSQHFNQGTQLKSDNLPFYANFLSDMTSNFLTNLLTGGKNKSQLFKEAGLQALGAGSVDTVGVIGGALGSINNNVGDGSFGDNHVSVHFSSPSSSKKITELTAGQQYLINIDMSGYLNAGLPLPTHAHITDKYSGRFINSGKTAIVNLNKNNPIIKHSFVAPTKPSVFNLDLVDDSGNDLKYVGFSFTIKGVVNEGSVKSARVIEFLPRGPQFSPR